MSERLIVCYITENDEELIDFSISSVYKEVDHIYIIYSQTKGDNTIERLFKKYGTEKITILSQQYEHDFIGANGKQRNEYLKIIKEKELTPCWVLILDSDEIVDDIKKLREWCNKNPIKKIKVYNPQMRHLIGSLQHEDSTKDKHWCLHRFFSWIPSVNYFYNEVEHPILLLEQQNLYSENLDIFVLWHLGYSKFTLDIRKKYLNHLKKSNIHTPQYLDNWYRQHLFRAYPSSAFNPTELPQVIKDFFLIPNLNDEIYFANRGLEVKHFIDAHHWIDYFNPKSFLEIGCGLGHRVFAFDSYSPKMGCGIDISQWAINNSPYKHLVLWQEDITGNLKTHINYDLVVAYDILEHIEEEKIPIALKNVFELTSKNALFSIPFLGDPNLEADVTHKTKKPREWWEEQIKNAGFKITETPKYFLYAHQLIIAEKMEKS